MVPTDRWPETEQSGMNDFASVEADRLLSGRADWVDADLASAVCEHPLESVETEYPHHARTMDGPDDCVAPSDRHPVFYGSFDWHSAVHSHWTLVRSLRLFDDHPDHEAIVERIDGRLTPENVEREVAYFEDHEGFENPYGWGWLLRLAAELDLWDGKRAGEWRETLRPLEARIATLVESEFLTQERPLRVGTHSNSAFGLACVLDYARTTGDDALAGAASERARDWFADDTDYPIAYEPLGWDFLSPALAEADLMRRVLDGEAFAAWLADFLPELAGDASGTAAASADPPLDPIGVDADTEDGMELHLVGLNLSRAWSLAGVADTLAAQGATADSVSDRLAESAVSHARAGLDRAFTDEYAGAHWLSSFVLYLLTREEGAIAPDAG